MELPDSDRDRARVVAGLIDHTLLKPATTTEQVDALCEEALRWGFFSVCVNPVWIPRCVERVAGSHVKVCSVSGFPLGSSVTEVKALEAARGVAAGADEIDMVAAVGRLREGQEDAVREEIEAVVQAADGRPVKVILECCDLTDDQIKVGCRLARVAGAAFVKTSTGYGRHGATEAHVRLLRETVGESMGVKASGGIRDLEACVRMISAGATRIGTSTGVTIVSDLLEA